MLSRVALSPAAAARPIIFDFGAQAHHLVPVILDRLLGFFELCFNRLFLVIGRLRRVVRGMRDDVFELCFFARFGGEIVFFVFVDLVLFRRHFPLRSLLLGNNDRAGLARR